MRIEIFAFIEGKPITFKLSDLDKFTGELLKLPDLFEYDLEYFGEEVRAKRRI
jgi:hypothetical protein